MGTRKAALSWCETGLFNPGLHRNSVQVPCRRRSLLSHGQLPARYPEIKSNKAKKAEKTALKHMGSLILLLAS